MEIINKTPELRTDMVVSVSVTGSYLDRLEITIETKQDGYTTNDYHTLEIPCNLGQLPKQGSK